MIASTSLDGPYAGKVEFYRVDASGNAYYTGQTSSTEYIISATGNIFLPASVTIGQTYNSSATFTGFVSGSNVTATCQGSVRIFGFETVTVPAGTFTALKLVQTEVWSFGYTDIGTFWLVSGLGIVKYGSADDGVYEEEDLKHYVILNAQPQAQSVAVGASATLSVTATGGGSSLTYQWRKDGVNVSGANASSYTLPSAQVSNAGSYTVVVSNTAGSVTSSAATLTVTANAQIDTTPYRLDASPEIQIKRTFSPERNVGRNFVTSATNQFGIPVIARTWVDSANPYGIGYLRVGSDGSIYYVGTRSTVPGNPRYSFSTNGGLPFLPASVTIGATYTSEADFRGINSDGNSSHATQTRSLRVVGFETVTVPAGTFTALKLEDSGNQDYHDGKGFADPQTDTYWFAPGVGLVKQVTLYEVVTRAENLEHYVILNAQPQAQSVAVGASATLSVTATGGGSSLTYQWRKDGVNVSGANASSYTLPSAQVSNAGSYTVVVSNTAGSVTSSAATLTVNGIPVVTSAATATAPVGQSFSYQITASSSPTGFNATGLPAGLSVNLGTGLISGTPTMVGTSTVTLSASNADGTGTRVLTLTVALPPSITSQPQGQTVNPGQSAVFSVTVTGTDPFSYQWRKNGGNLAGATSATLTLSNVQAANAGDYSVVVSNGAGSATSAVASLAVNGPVTLLTQPQAQTLNRGAVLALAVTASGTQPITYQWRLNGANLPNATSATYTVASVQLSDAGNYAVVLNNIVGSVTSTVVPVTVVVAAGILTQPVSQTVLPGSSVTFLVTAEGSGTLSYQWTKNGQNVSGATTATLALNTVTTNDQGAYRVTVRNDRGSATSTPAFLTVVQRQVKVGEVQTTNLMAGSALWVPITLTGDGSEHAVSVSVAYDPNLLTLSGVSNRVTAGVLVVTNVTSNGVVGVSVTLPAGQRFSAGSNALVELEFTVATVTRQMVGSLLLPEAPLPNLVTDTNDVPLVSEFAAGVVVFKTPVPQTVGVSTGLKGETFSFAVPPGATRAMFVRVLIYDLGVDRLGNAIRVFNAAGTNAAGIPFVLLPRALTAGEQLDLALEYYVSDRTTVPTPRFVTEIISGGLTVPTGTRVEPERARMFAGKFHVDFRTGAGKRYFIEYAPSPAGPWETSFPPVVGSGSAMQWTDTGPPRTSSLPTGQRFYRLILAD